MVNPIEFSELFASEKIKKFLSRSFGFEVEQTSVERATNVRFGSKADVSDRRR